MEETVEINGQEINKVELAFRSAMNNTIKQGRIRDLKILVDLAEKCGIDTNVNEHEKSKAAAESAVKKIFSFFEKSRDIDPEDVKALDADGLEEANTVICCPRCGPT